MGVEVIDIGTIVEPHIDARVAAFFRLVDRMTDAEREGMYIVLQGCMELDRALTPKQRKEMGDGR